MKRAAHSLVLLLVGLVLLASIQSCVARRDEFILYPTTSEAPPLPGEVRVLLVDADNCRIAVRGGYEIKAGNDTLFSDAAPLLDATVRATLPGLRLGDQEVKHASVDVIPSRDGSLVVNGLAYRGFLRLTSKPQRGTGHWLAAINVVPLDEYLAGVVCSEMPSVWPAAVLKAQAIAARTYVLYRARLRRSWDYDVSCGTGDQVYKGIAGETASARRAVDATRGAVLLYDYKLLPAYYHALCGGRTASRSTVFGEEDITPLSGVVCGYCDPARHGMSGAKIQRLYRWQVSIPAAELAKAFAADGRTIAGIGEIVPVGADAGGYVRDVEVRPAGAAPFRMGLDKFRALAGPGRLISPSFTCSRQGDAFVFLGRGYGHGVGMCQWGAKGMANAGYGTSAILEHYYPGAEIVKVY